LKLKKHGVGPSPAPKVPGAMARPPAPEAVREDSATSRQRGSNRNKQPHSTDKGAGTRTITSASAVEMKAMAPEFVPGALAVAQAMQGAENMPPNIGRGTLSAMHPQGLPQQPVAAYPATHPQPPQPEGSNSGEIFLMQMLGTMDQHMQQVREIQQALVATVEHACRQALEPYFGRLVLVGSAALRVETPGSDVDVVCFTRRDNPQNLSALDVLRCVDWALRDLIHQHFMDYPVNFTQELIDVARVPILRVLWGPADNPVAVDVSVDQPGPLEHVRWFQRVGAAPSPKSPPPVVAPLVTLTLRCVKWWLKQRQIPRTKEGGLPTMAWLLMAVHVCSLRETHEQAMVSGQRPMAALLTSLAAFFCYYQCLERLDGVLKFATDGTASDFSRRERIGSGPASLSPWAELAVLDPTKSGKESINLVPRLFPATQLLLAHELQRAHERLEKVPRGQEATLGESSRILEEVFGRLPEGMNTLPSYVVSEAIAALVVCGEGAAGTGVEEVEIALIDSVAPKSGWQADFLLRGDNKSEMVVKLLDLEDRTGRCHLRDGKPVSLCPCSFVSRVVLEQDGHSWRIDTEGLDRFKAMRQITQNLVLRRQKLEEQHALQAQAAPAKAEDSVKASETSPTVSTVTTVPSPLRSARSTAV